MRAMVNGRSLIDLCSDEKEIEKRSDNQQRQLQALLFERDWPCTSQHLKQVRNGYSCNMLNLSKGNVINQQVRAFNTHHQINQLAQLRLLK